MKNRFVEVIIKKRLLVFILMAMVMVGGVASYIMLPKQHFPEVVLPAAVVSVVYPGASAEDMEELVTKKLEAVVQETDYFDTCTTTTQNSVCAAMVTLDKDISEEVVDAAFDDLRIRAEALRASLPSGVTSIAVDTTILDTAGLVLAVTGEGVSGDELGQRTEDLCDQLKLLDGVQKVEIHGRQDSEVAVHVDAERLNMLDVSLAELGALIGAQNSIVPTGTIEVGDSKVTVNSSGKFENLDEIRNIVVGQSEVGSIIRLSDIAEIKIQEPEDSAFYTYNKQKANLIVLFFKPGINVVAFGDAIRDCIDEYRKTLPDNIQAEEVYFQPDVVGDAIGGFQVNLLSSIALVLVVVMVGMNLRNGVVVALVIPLSILANFIVMKVMGVDIQFISLAALIVVLGMLVDNAIVVSDSIQTRLDQGMERTQAAIEGTQEVVVPVFISMLTTVSAFASLLALTGAYKQLVSSLPIVIITCLVASFVVSICVTPLVSWYALKPRAAKKDGSQKLAELYDKVFERAFRNRKKTIVILLAFMAICTSSLFFIDMQVLPKAFKDVVTISVKSHDENDIDKTADLVRQIEDILDEQPEVRYYLSGVGNGIPRYDFSIQPSSSGNQIGDIFVRVDLSKGKRFKETYEMVEFLQDELDHRVSGTIMVDELGIMVGTTKPVEMKIYSEDLNDLNHASEMVAGFLRDMEGTKNIDSGQELATYNYYIDMDTMKLNSLGLMKGEVQNELSIALMGRDVSLYRKNGKEYSVVLDSNLENQSELSNYKVKASSSGNKYALQQFAEIELEPEISSLTRMDGRRGCAVGCYNENGYSDVTLQIALEKRISETEFPESVSFENSGMKHDFITAAESIAGAAVLSVVIIFLILIFQFNSVRIPLLIFVSVPFGVMSGIAALFITGEQLTVFALLGCVSLLGCVLANAIVLVEFIIQERNNGTSLEESCRSAGRKRFRPILMSTMTTVLGLIPLAFGDDALFVPMARLMMVGLAVSMVVNLVLVPIIYYMMEEKKTR